MKYSQCFPIKTSNSDKHTDELSKLLVEKLSNACLQTGLQQLQAGP